MNSRKPWLLQILGSGIACLLLCAAINPVLADTQQSRFDQYSISAQASREVDNDRVSATLNVLAEGQEPAELADDVNRRMRLALDVLAEFPSIVAETRDYRTEPQYEIANTGKRRLAFWRTTQSLALQSTDVALMSEVLAELQNDLQVQHLHFDVTPETRERVTEELMVEALAKLRTRAQLVTDSMGLASYRIVNATIITDEPTAYQPRGGVARLEARSTVAPVVLEGGDSRIGVNINARIQLFDGDSHD